MHGGQYCDPFTLFTPRLEKALLVSFFFWVRPNIWGVRLTIIHLISACVALEPKISLQRCWSTETKGGASVFMQRCCVHMRLSSSVSSKSQHRPQLHYALIKWMDFTHGDDVAFNLFSSMDYPISQLFVFFECSVNEAPTEGYVCNSALLPIFICAELLEFPYRACI